MDPKRIEEIEARLAAATAGDWSADDWDVVLKGSVEPLATCMTMDDAAFFAGAKQDIPDLLGEVSFLQMENHGLRTAVHNFGGHRVELLSAAKLASQQLNDYAEALHPGAKDATYAGLMLKQAIAKAEGRS